MKKIFILFLIVLTGFSIGCKEENIVIEEVYESVRVREAKEETYLDIMHYVGQIGTELFKKSFKTGGKIEGVYIKEGDYIKKGDLLVSLEIEDFKLGEDASKATYEAAKLDYEKAKTSVVFLRDQKNKLEKLFNEGAVSKQSLDEIEMQLDVQENVYIQAQKLVNQAYTGLKFDQNTLENTKLVSDIDGYIVSLLVNQGEMIGSGYPAVIMRKEEQRAEVFMSAEDLSLIKIGMDCEVKINDKNYKAKVKQIDEIPDEQTRTYKVLIDVVDKILEDEYYIGALCDVDFILGEEKGIWIEMNYIKNDGSDYVYIVEDGLARRRDIKIDNFYENKMKITGVNIGEKIITEGSDNLIEGQKVIILE